MLLALLAAILFGLTVPAVERIGAGVGPFSTAALLYLGAGLAAVCFWLARPGGGGRLGGRHIPRLLAVAIFGAALAPALLVFGIHRVGATTTSLLLNLEVVFTVLLARAVYCEHLGRRVVMAATVMVFGGAVLVFDSARGWSWQAAGSLAVAAAALCWAVDNTLSCALSGNDPHEVVAAKGVLGCVLTGAGAFLSAERVPGQWQALGLLACGMTGYGLSLKLYLLAQRRIGAARTGSVFGTAPFIGVAAAWAMGGRQGGVWTAAAAALFAVGIVLHSTERHEHEHSHDALDHEHAHRHDDGHHGHGHEHAVGGDHTHLHSHAAFLHAHTHAPDCHHLHRHP